MVLIATGVITNHLMDPSGTALSGVTVNARLKPLPGGFRTASYYEISQLETTTSDASGDWSLVLEINTDITPGDSYWEVEELIPASAGEPRVWSIQVGAGTNTLYASLVNTPPSVSVPSYLTQSVGDARYMPYGALALGSIAAVGTATQTGTATTAASSNHVHPLNPSVVGTGLALTTGVLSVTGLTNSQAASGWLYTQTSTATATVGISQGQIRYNSNSLAVTVYTGNDNVSIPLTPSAAKLTAIRTTTQTAYLTPAGAPTVTVWTGARALVTVSCEAQNNTSPEANYMSFAVSGATTLAADDARAAFANTPVNNLNDSLQKTVYLANLTPGLNTFTVQTRASGPTGQATFGAASSDITIIVQPLP